MFKKYSKFVLPILFIVLISLGLGILYAQKQRQKEEKEITTKTYAPTPKIPKEYKGQIDNIIKFNVDESALKIPKEVPLLEVKYKTITLSDAKKIAAIIGTKLEPLIFNDAREGTKYIWSFDNQSLIITPKTSQVSYYLGFVEPPKVENKNLSTDSLNEIAQNFLVNKIGILQESAKLVKVSNLMLNPQSQGFIETTDKSKAILYQLDYTYKTSEYQILTLTPSQPFIYLQILPNGEIYHSEITFLDEASETSQKFELKQFNDIKASVNEAILVNLSNDYIVVGELNKNQIEEITVNKISLAYLLESTKTPSLKPVFLLEGPAKVTNSPADWAQLYMPAIKYPTAYPKPTS